MPAMSPATSDFVADGGRPATARVLMRWLVGLRWAVFAVLALTLPLDEALLGFHVRYAIALPVVAAVLIVNAALHRRLTAGAPALPRPLPVRSGLAPAPHPRAH